MRIKYVEERWPRLMQIGTTQDGRVGVCTVDDRVDIALSPAEAEKLIEHWNHLQDALTRCALAFADASPEAFTDFWYNSEITTGGKIRTGTGEL